MRTLRPVTLSPRAVTRESGGSRHCSPLPTSPRRCRRVQLEGEKAAASDKQSRVLDELRDAHLRMKELDRQAKAAAAQQKAAAAQKQVGGWAEIGWCSVPKRVGWGGLAVGALRNSASVAA